MKLRSQSFEHRGWIPEEFAFLTGNRNPHLAWDDVPAGTQSGQKFRVAERGVPSARTGRRGDLVVEVRLALPKDLDERSKQLLRQFGELNAGDDVRGDWLSMRRGAGG